MHLGCLQDGGLLHSLLFSNTVLFPFGRAGSNPEAAKNLPICCIHSLKMQRLAFSMCVLVIWLLCCAEACWAKDLALLFCVLRGDLINISRVGVKRMGPDSFQWCSATGQGPMGTNWSRGRSSWTWGRTSSLWGWRSTGTGCPEKLWILLWRYSRQGPVQPAVGDPALVGWLD